MQGPALASHNLKIRGLIAGRYLVCVQHTRMTEVIHDRYCLRIFSFLFTMFKNRRSRVSIKAMNPPQPLFWVFPKFFEVSDLYPSKREPSTSTQSLLRNA